jgi:hypothetical protein
MHPFEISAFNCPSLAHPFHDTILRVEFSLYPSLTNLIDRRVTSTVTLNCLTMSWFAPETGTGAEDKVYIRDAEYAWLPATVVQTSNDDDSKNKTANNNNNNKEEGDNDDSNNKRDNTRVQVRIDLPSDWESTTVCKQQRQSKQNKQSPSPSETTTTTTSSMPHGQTRWVSLSDYPKHQLLLQNQGILARDMAELPHLHEAAILYQVKERHVREKPYTRVGEIVVAVNPCQWIEGLYTKEEQEKYAKILVWQEGTLRYVTLRCIALYCIFLRCVIRREWRAISQLKSMNDSPHECVCSIDRYSRRR